MLEETIKEYGRALIPSVITVFIIAFVYTGITYGGKTGIWGVLSNISTKEQADTQIHEVPDDLDDMSQNVLPDVSMKNLVYKSHTDISFLGMFTITKNGVTYDGTEEEQGNFKITLNSVINKYGKDVLTEMTKEDYDSAEEVFWEMIYDKDADVLYFINTGVYELNVTVQSEGSDKTKYTVRIAVALPSES